MHVSPLISIIIPLYNKELTIDKTIQSVLNQSFSNFELIIVNDGSTDNSLETISARKDPRLVIHTKKNGGVSEARNFGVRHAQSDYIFFLDADDIISEDCLAHFYHLIQKYPNESVFVSNFKITEVGKKDFVYCFGKHEKIYQNPIKDLWNRQLFLRPGNFVLKKDCFQKSGFFNPDISIYEDLEFALRILNDFRVVYSPQIVLEYQKEFSTLSKKILPLSREFCYHISLKSQSFYEKLVLTENIYWGYLNRKAIGDVESSNLLLKKLSVNPVLKNYAIMMRKIVNTVNRLSLING